MCGVAGLACLRSDCSRAHEVVVGALCDRQAHRGPDDQGVVVLDDVCLGSRRLSILDVSAAGHMPMSDPTGRWWVVHNGEIYNFRDIRRELEGEGHVFVSESDTEVILHAFMEWGTDAFQRFVGMFATALYDRNTRSLTLVRDRYGIKPLYYVEVGGHLLFSSELKALLDRSAPARVDRQKLTEWLLYRNVDALTPETLVEGVRSVMPGQILQVRGGEIIESTFYQPLSFVDETVYREQRTAGSAELVERVEGTLREAVRSRLVSDVPVGTLCSGGLDSSLVTALAAEFTTQITAFHVSVAEAPNLDERRFAERLTRNLGIELVSHDLTAASFRATLPRAVYHSDLPLTHPNSVAYLQISEVARAHGVIVLQSGEGADELFGGYSWSYRRLRTLQRLRGLLRLVPGSMVDRFILLAYSMAGLPATTHKFREVLPATVAAIDRFAREDWAARCEEAYGFVDDAMDRRLLGRMLADLSDFLAPLLRRLDRMTMAASVESRVPFLDHRLVHQAINLPLSYRIGARADKWLLKRVADTHLPRSNVWRKKMGFPLPLGDFIGPLAILEAFTDGFCERILGYARSALEDRVTRWAEDPFAFFGLLTLEMWGRMFVMGEELGEVEFRFGVEAGAGDRVEVADTRSRAVGTG